MTGTRTSPKLTNRFFTKILNGAYRATNGLLLVF
nr:MAG TPA_asm: hypothetical protein [Caudoviricetes sp.]